MRQLVRGVDARDERGEDVVDDGLVHAIGLVVQIIACACVRACVRACVQQGVQGADVTEMS